MKDHSINIAEALAEWRQWNLKNGYPMDWPSEGWFSVPQADFPLGIDVYICEDEDTGEYGAWVYPNYIDSNGYLSTDIQTVLAYIPSTEW